MEKKFYTTPDLRIIEVDMKDIICNSPGTEENDINYDPINGNNQ